MRVGLGTGFHSWSGHSSPHAAVEHAVQQEGYIWIDTSENYIHEGVYAEELIGQLHSKRDLRIMSKVAPEHVAYADVLQSCERSLSRLQCDHLEVYFIHWPNPDVPIEETMLALNKLQRDGKIKSIGYSNCTLAQLKEAEQYGDIDYVEWEYNLLERSIEQNGILGCGKKIICYSPLFHNKHFSSHQTQLLQTLGAKYHVTGNQMTLGWILRHPQTIVISKTSNPQHLKENAVSNYLQLADEDIVVINRTFSRHVTLINPLDITVLKSESGQAYLTEEQAIRNEKNFCPSPLAMETYFRQGGELLKPIRVQRRGDPENVRPITGYYLTGGAVSFWGWRLAFGNKPIPAYIR